MSAWSFVCDILFVLGLSVAFAAAFFGWQEHRFKGNAWLAELFLGAGIIWFAHLFRAILYIKGYIGV